MKLLLSAIALALLSIPAWNAWEQINQRHTIAANVQAAQSAADEQRETELAESAYWRAQDLALAAIDDEMHGHSTTTEAINQIKEAIALVEAQLATEQDPERQQRAHALLSALRTARRDPIAAPTFARSPNLLQLSSR
jgi:hypothetical protein